MIMGDAELLLAPQKGGSVAFWRVGGVDILRPDKGPTARDQGCYPLVPFSNRVAGAEFLFEGQRHTLPKLPNGFALHGCGSVLPWDREGCTMRLAYPGGELWPFAFDAEQIFELSARALIITTRLTSRHTGLAPAAIGQHPFFARPEGTSLRFAAQAVWQNGPDAMPERRVSVPPEWDFTTPRVPDAHADNCFVGWAGTADIVTSTHAVHMQADPIFGNLVYYAPVGGNFLCLEPVMNMNDGLNRWDDPDCGMAILEPGGVLEGTVRIEVER